jgi:hypothetical protein
MVEKLKALSLIVAILDVSIPSQQNAHKVLGEIQCNFLD